MPRPHCHNRSVLSLRDCLRSSTPARKGTTRGALYLQPLVLAATWARIGHDHEIGAAQTRLIRLTIQAASPAEPRTLRGKTQSGGPEKERCSAVEAARHTVITIAAHPTE
jgi:hypothetical protein